jgi:aspartyl/asparaginyl-tRNA synthetase
MTIKDDFYEVLLFAESALLSVITEIQNQPKYQDLISVVYKKYSGIRSFRTPPNGKVPRITYSTAIRKLNKLGFELADGDDIRLVFICVFFKVLWTRN